ncbi:MAG: 50S ribosomal protein L15 [Candidatus Marinimicrobia bacterium]|nr:50S ribosomal protein L15 [Candidatus Neomarinimicrobiota bacterium]MCK4447877.1 50S ribosomal protein L15 [Candidatus Neomarinimicrobiota bacterium]
MDLGSLKYAPGSRKNRKRLGRGDASGTGGTSGRGHKGYGSRSGSKSRSWMEGGTMPLYRRVPKRGFTNMFKEKFQIVNLDVIGRLQIPEVTIDVLYERGIIESIEKPVKILGNGEVISPISVVANAFSKSAKEKIESAGGKAEII